MDSQKADSSVTLTYDIEGGVNFPPQSSIELKVNEPACRAFARATEVN